VITAVTLVGAWALCRWITRSRAGKVLVAIRDSETRVLFSGYSPADYKLFVFVVSAALAGVAGALYAPQVGIITPAKIGVLPSIEMVVWVAAGGRGTLIGAVVGAIGVNWIQSWLTTSYPDVWLLFLGALFMGVVLFFPDGVVGALRHALAFVRHRRESPSPAPTIERVSTPPPPTSPPLPPMTASIQSIGDADVSRLAPRSGHPRTEAASRAPLQ
jgi:urea transport system permease protein